jgi:hypothetical protein
VRYLLCLALAATGWAAGPDAATITGRVFDTYHRPVPAAVVVTIERRTDHGRVWIFPSKPAAVVDKKGMFQLTLPPGSYRLAAAPPPRTLDFTTIFPVYYRDTLDPNQAQAVVLRAGELRPFIDFLLIEQEPHQLAGRVTDVPAEWKSGAVAVLLYASSGYAGPLRTVLTDADGRFRMEQVPAGSYSLIAAGPVVRLDGLNPLLGSHPRYGSVAVALSAPELDRIQIPLRPGAIQFPVILTPEVRR